MARERDCNCKGGSSQKHKKADKAADEHDCEMCEMSLAGSEHTSEGDLGMKDRRDEQYLCVEVCRAISWRADATPLPKLRPRQERNFRRGAFLFLDV
jgi:hypothetical protein